MPESVSIQVGGNVDGSIVVGDNNFVVNTNHGTILYQQAPPAVRARQFVPQPPRPPRDFLDRSAELAKLEEWIAVGKMVLLHAPDGMGKSALLRQSANTAAGKAMPSGVILLEAINMEGQTLGPDDILQNLFDALFESQPPLKVTSLSARTYLSNTRPLILLDDVVLAPALQKILPDLFPKGAILFSAEGALGPDMEHLALGPLPRPESIQLLASKAGIALDNSNRSSLDAICELLSDVALAVVIAGNVIAATHAVPESALLAMQKIPAASASLVTSALDRAYSFAFNTLSLEEQKILSVAALTPGVSMTPEWLSAALGGENVETALERLKSLGLLFANSPRLRLPSGLRLAARRASVLDADSLVPRLVEFLTAPLKNNPQNWEHIEAELGNFFGALDSSMRLRAWADVIRLGRALDPYLTLHGLWDAWETVLGLISAAARNSGESATQAWTLHQMGIREIGVGARARALGFLKQALELRRGMGDAAGMAFTQHNINFLMGLPPSGAHTSGPPQTKRGGGRPSLFRACLITLGVLILAIAAIVVWHLLFPPAPPSPTIMGNAGLPGVSLSYEDRTGKKTIYTDPNGNYSFQVAYNWSGSVTPREPGYTFSPPSRVYRNVQSDQIDQNYSATALTFTISGNAGVGRALLHYDYKGPQTVLADGSGNYSLTVPYDWTGTVTPQEDGYTFSPDRREYASVESDQINQDYLPIPITFSISGFAGGPGVTLKYYDGKDEVAMADGKGYYMFQVPWDWSGTVTPSEQGYAFKPSSRDYTHVQSNQLNQDYAAYLVIGKAGRELALLRAVA